MRTSLLLVTGLVLCAPRAFAAPAPWCGNASFKVDSYDLDKLSSSDGNEVLPILAKAACSSSPQVEAQRAELEQARAAWGKAYDMEDADWADMVAFVQVQSFSFKRELSTKTLATFTPVDQYGAMSEPFTGEINGRSAESSDALYVADALDATLTETGRLAFLEYCVKGGSVSPRNFDVVTWAVCQADIDAFDPHKLGAELHKDTAHDGATKMWLRFRAKELAAALKELAPKKAALIKQDAEYERVFTVAAKAREEWHKTIGANAKLLELASAMDSARFFGSRKQLDGCEARTAEALADAVATIPAKAFTGMHDDREAPSSGFAYHAGPLLAKTPVVHLAAIAYVECQPQSAIGDYLAASIQGAPGARGPRSAVLTALIGETFHFDDVNKKSLFIPKFDARPYMRAGGAVSSAGGVVKSVRPDKEHLVVALEKTSRKILDCAKEHEGRVVRIRPDGSLEREIICDGTKWVTQDTTWGDFQIRTADQKWLKPGVVFSATSAANGGGAVIAVWPDRNAATPQVVLGARVK